MAQCTIIYSTNSLLRNTLVLNFYHTVYLKICVRVCIRIFKYMEFLLWESKLRIWCSLFGGKGLIPGLDHSCSSNSIPGLGPSLCCSEAKKKKKKRKDIQVQLIFKQHKFECAGIKTFITQIFIIKYIGKKFWRYATI